MLVITRKPRQGFYITEDIYVYISSVDGGKVKIGIQAPKAMSIKREELINKASVSSANATEDDDSVNQQKEYHPLQKQLKR